MSTTVTPKLASPVNDFFDQYSDFLVSSTVGATSKRLNFRYHQIIDQNRHLIKGKRCIDLGSHDGRWSFAAIRGADAAFCMGIEPRAALVENSKDILRKNGLPAGTYDMRVGNCHADLPKLASENERFDVGFCLGFLYHTPSPFDVL